jgi:hypothetical protein
VVHLEVEREAPVSEALDEVHLPRRPVEVDGVAVQARDQDAQLALPAGARQSRAAHVVLGVEVGVLHPGLQRAGQQLREAQLEVPRVRDGGVALDLVHQLHQEVLARTLGHRRELQQRAHVHHRLARLGGEEREVQGSEALLVWHARIVRGSARAGQAT